MERASAWEGGVHGVAIDAAAIGFRACWLRLEVAACWTEEVGWMF